MFRKSYFYFITQNYSAHPTEIVKNIGARTYPIIYARNVKKKWPVGGHATTADD